MGSYWSITKNKASATTYRAGGSHGNRSRCSPQGPRGALGSGNAGVGCEKGIHLRPGSCTPALTEHSSTPPQALREGKLFQNTQHRCQNLQASPLLSASACGGVVCLGLAWALTTVNKGCNWHTCQRQSSWFRCQSDRLKKGSLHALPLPAPDQKAERSAYLK